MFAAVRNRFALWRSHMRSPQLPRRARRLSALFLFEFIVVVLGVLVAQSLQEYASSLRDRTDMRTQRARADFQIADSASTSEYWLALAPCLSSQMDRVMQALASGKAPAEVDVTTPPYPTARISPWSEQSILTLRREEGDEIAAHYVSLVDIAAFQTDHVRRLAHEWAPLRLADPANGPMNESDRAAVRVAASRTQAELERIASNARAVLRRANALKIRAHTVDPIPTLPPHCISQAAEACSCCNRAVP
jgi:hypothetical protein